MKIEATCGTCGRTFVLSQIGPDSDAPGRCPFCGAHFARHYSSLLIDSVDEAERASQRFVQALDRLQGIETGFQVDIEGLLAEVFDAVRRSDRRRAAS